MAAPERVYLRRQFKDVVAASRRCPDCIAANAENVSASSRCLCDFHWDCLRSRAAGAVPIEDREEKDSSRG